MPLHRSARLFTLGLALAGTCAAQNTLENKQTQRQLKQQQKADKSQGKADKAERKALNTKQQKKADKAQDQANKDAAAAGPTI